MKSKILLSIVLVSNLLFAQKPCDFTSNINDSIGTYKATKEYLVYEKNLGNKATYIFNSITITDGVPALSMQIIEKSSDFITAKCLDKNSRVYFQLQNGKIVTLIHVDSESCGTLIRDENARNNRLLTGYFLFRKEEYKELEKSPILYIRIKYGAQYEDYIYKKELVAEIDSKTYYPENYFIDYFHCLNDN